MGDQYNIQQQGLEQKTAVSIYSQQVYPFTMMLDHVQLETYN